MPNARQVFDKSVGTARRVRDRTRVQLVSNFVGEIQANLGEFDPIRLRQLGPAGLKTLLGALRTTNRTVEDEASTYVRAWSPEASIPKGWAHLRRPEHNFWLAGIAWGISMGMLFILLGSVFRNVLD